MGFRAFVSCSVRSQDEPVVRWFDNLLRNYDIEPHVVGLQPEIGLLTGQIKDWIRNTDCTVAILTRRDKIEGRDAWKAPDWVRDEAVVAKDQGKPMAIFVEEGVEVGGLLAEDMYVTFERERIGWDSIERIHRYMQSLARKLVKAKQISTWLILGLAVVVLLLMFSSGK